MEVLRSPIRELGVYEEIEKSLKKKEKILLSGCIDSQKIHMMDGIGAPYKKRLILTYSDQRMREIYEDMRTYDKQVKMYPAKDLIFFEADIRGNQLLTERMKTMRHMIESEQCTVVTTFSALMTPQIPLKIVKKNMISMKKGDNFELTKLSEKLTVLGYEKVYQVEGPGQFSVRGDILDIFDLTEENPYRIDFWGDEIENIRSFDCLSQRSVEPLEEIQIYPATEMIITDSLLSDGMDNIQKDAERQEKYFREKHMSEEAGRIRKAAQNLHDEVFEFGNKSNLESYIRYFFDGMDSFLQAFAAEETIVCLDEPTHVREHAEAVELEFRESMSHRLEKGYALPGQVELLFPQKKILALMEDYPVAMLSVLDQKKPLLKPDQKFDIPVVGVSSYNNSFEALVKELTRYRKEGYRVLILSGSRSRAKRLAEDLTEQGVNAFYSENEDRVLQPSEVMTFYGRAAKGFAYPLLKFAVIADTDIFGAEKKKKKKKRAYEGQKISHFDDLKVGDYVVHESHGLGVYEGIEKVEIEHVVKDYMKISYRDGGILYVLATNLDAIQKYASADAKKPKLNKLGTQEWVRTKTKVRLATEEVAQDLVNLYAARGQRIGYVYGPDTVWQKEFEEMFPYEETDDQLKAIEDTKKDMESTKIMDRLVCGDVGYGKTEVAIRAAFKAVQEGKQVVFLVPTTILAQQHYNTFVQRMKDFPVRIALLSRFRTAAEQRKTIADLKTGMVDIVIGTHRVLSKDVTYKDLGLLIIDEEQRFGVTHKEKIKKMRETVDVLTLTATPIPRTLHMSLIGIRDMSLLEEAPQDRLPIQTFVSEYNEEIVREAILRELSRNGQVYYLYNRVNDIAEMAAKISKLLPEANVAFAHGQMKENELERIMLDFINGDIDVLVSTTIIETGLDIPNVNTIIVHDSDRMGLSQLYQLRGRVGRAKRNAYAFFMYRKDKILQEVAEKRLAAIREFTELGSGFKIAMRDLEIRGAGNLLGSQQHGHMAAVGYDLYCKMLNEAVKTLKGEAETLDFATTVEIDADAYIPPTYIVNEMQKLDIYKRIASLETEEEIEDMKEELLDRFGEIPHSAANLLRIAGIRIKAHRLYVTEIKGKNGELMLTMRPDAKLRVDAIPALLKKYKKKMTLQTKGTPYFLLHYVRTGIIEKDEENLLKAIEMVLTDMTESLL
ncbi:MAG: transcription-repair coupling factor [Lachnospiraceae bacterium]|jgi:transcription-repair coupling factor (superfamily II helicase)|nr:transcription-repair coupling factor [Lachnospiraceae bacterium]